MTKEEFVNAVDVAVGQSTVSDIKSVLKTPIGRQPDKKSIDLSNWYNNLSTTDKDNLHQVIEKTTDMCLFGMLCVLDGVRAIEDCEDKGELVLEFQKDTKSFRLNDERDMYLHDIYKSK
jgi:hypothetical protein